MFVLSQVKAMKGKKTDDPFTRRHTKPVMNFKSHQGGRSQVRAAPAVPARAAGRPPSDVEAVTLGSGSRSP